jgi:hypothetical protein
MESAAIAQGNCGKDINASMEGASDSREIAKYEFQERDFF